MASNDQALSQAMDELSQESVALREFEGWVRLRAAKLALLGIEPVRWSEQTSQALKEAQEPGASSEARELAAGLALAEWESHPSKDKMEGALSRLMALPARGEDGQWMLLRPLARSALKMDPASGQVLAMDSDRSWAAAVDETRLNFARARKVGQLEGNFSSWAYPATSLAEALAETPSDKTKRNLSNHMEPAWSELLSLAKNQARRALGPAWSLAAGSELEESDQGEPKGLSGRMAELDMALGAISSYGQLRKELGSGVFAQALERLIGERHEPTGPSPLEAFSQKKWSPVWRDAADELARGAGELSEPAKILERARAANKLARDGDEPPGQEGIACLLLAVLAPGVDPEIAARESLAAPWVLERVEHHSSQARGPSVEGAPRSRADGLKERFMATFMVDPLSLRARGLDGFERAMNESDLWRSRSIAGIHFVIAKACEEAQALKEAGQATASEWARRRQDMPAPSQIMLGRLGADLAFNALARASAQEARWIASVGLTDAAARLEAGAWREAIGAPLAKEEISAKAARDGASPFRAALALVEGSFSGSNPARACVGMRADFGLGEKELAAIENSPWGAVFAQVVGRAVAEAEGAGKRSAQAQIQGVAALTLLAGFSKLAGQQPATIEPSLGAKEIGALAKAIAPNARLSPTARSLLVAMQELSRAGSASADWDELREALGSSVGSVDFALRRAVEIARQAGVAGEAFVAQALGAASAEVELFKENKKKAVANFEPLPMAWAGDEELRLKQRQARSVEAPPPDPRVAEQLQHEGFAGRMAMLALRAGREPEFREGASEQSRLNAWLAEGRSAAKDWLGMSEAAWKAAKQDEAMGKAMLSACLPLAIQEQRVKEERALAPKKEPAAAVNARLLGEFATQAASSGLSPQAAMMAARVAGESVFHAGELELSGKYSASACRCCWSGASLADAWAGVLREAKACEALRPRWRQAMMERAQELLDEEARQAPARKSKASNPYEGQKILTAKAAPWRALRRSEQQLAQEMSDIQDWANDWAGRFYSQLPAKLTWQALAGGSQRWHEEAGKLQGTGASWDPHRHSMERGGRA